VIAIGFEDDRSRLFIVFFVNAYLCDLLRLIDDSTSRLYGKVHDPSLFHRKTPNISTYMKYAVTSVF